MFYLIYKTTNKINGKHYIGQHVTSKKEDGYLGSGKILKQAIRKYGVENFNREVLFECSSEEELNQKEKEIVTIEFCLEDSNYNICEGGFGGGFRYINRLGLNWTPEKNRKISPFKTKEFKERRKDFVETNREHFRSGAKKRNEIYGLPKCDWVGRKHSEETKKKMSLVKIGKKLGQDNSQFGTCWITNGKENKKIRKDQLDNWINVGYRKGRVT